VKNTVYFKKVVWKYLFLRGVNSVGSRIISQFILPPVVVNVVETRRWENNIKLDLR
jgi:hypothetical protein